MFPEALVAQFLHGQDTRGELAKAVANKTLDPGHPSRATCVTTGGNGITNVYAFCENLNPAHLPVWAQGADGVLIQTLYLSSTEEFRQGKSNTALSVLQGFRNERSDWYEHDGIDRQLCTTPQLTRTDASPSASRWAYTNEYGFLESVDCGNLGDRVSIG